MNISLATRVLRAIGLLAVSFCTGWTVPRRRCLSSARTAWGPLLPLLALLLAAGPAPVASAAAPVLSLESSFTGTEDTPFLLAGPNLVVSTLAGSSTAAFLDGTGTAARFNTTNDVAVDAAGNVYVADHGNRRIRKITPAGVVSTLAGSGVSGSTDGTGAAALFSQPKGLAVDTTYNVYVADYGGPIRKITSEGVVSTLTNLTLPHGAAVDASGFVYVVEHTNHRIRKITPGGVVSTFAGSGTSGFLNGTGTGASFRAPRGVAVDTAGNLYVADFDNHLIRKITSAGVVSTLAGSGTSGFLNGTPTAARFNCPWGVAVDAAGWVYVADWGNHRIRKISPAGEVTTVAGTGTGGFLNGTASAAQFDYPQSVAVDTAGNLTVTDNFNGVRRISRTSGVVVSDADGGTLTVALSVSNGTLTATLTAGATVSAGALASASVTLSGTPTQLNAALDTLLYQGTANTTGADTLTTTVSDGGTPVTATASITVTAVNDAPTLAAISNPAAIMEDASAQTVSLTGIAAGGSETQVLTVTATSSNTALIPNPTVTYTSAGTTGSLSYTPVGNASGTALITVTVTDNGGTADSGVATTTQTFTVAVTAVNDAPTLAAIADPTAILEDAGAQTVSLTGIAAGGSETQVLTVTATSSNTALIPNPTVTYTSAATTGSLSYTPVANANGTAVITVTVTDNGGTANSGVATTTRTFTVAVTAVNDAPTLAAIADPTAILEDASAQTVSLTGIAAGGSETQVLTVTATSSNTSLIPNPTVSYTSAATTGSLSYTPVGNANGTALITVTVTDNGGTADSGVATTTQTFTVAVTAVNDAPILAAIAAPTAILEDASAQTVSLTGIAAGGSETQVLTVTATSSNTALIPNPTVTYTSAGTTGSLSYTPVANASGTAIVTVTVTDDGGTANGGVATTTQTFTVTVTAVNDAPVAAASTVTTIAEDVADDINTGTQVLALVAGFSDVDSGAVKGLAVTAVDTANGTWYYSTNAGGAWTTLTGVSTSAARLLKGDDANYKVRFVPAANFNGTATLTYQAWDQTSGTAGTTANVTTNGGSTAYSSNTGTGTVTVTAVNDAPSFALPAGASGAAGAAWTAQASGSQVWYSIASSADGTKLAAVANGGLIYTSTDSGATWTAQAASGSRSWRSIASSTDGTKLAAAGYGNVIYTSTDSGVNWTAQAASGTRNWQTIASSADGTKLAAAANGSQIYTSADSGATWTPRATSRNWFAIAVSADGAKLAAGAIAAPIYTSTDSGVTWTAQATGSLAWSAIASSADGTKLAAVVSPGYIYTSTDSGANWTTRLAITSFWQSIASSSDGTKLAAVPRSGVIYTSTDSGANWTAQAASGSQNWQSIASSADGSKLAAGIDGGQIYTSTGSSSAYVLTALEDAGAQSQSGFATSLRPPDPPRKKRGEEWNEKEPVAGEN